MNHSLILNQPDDNDDLFASLKNQPAPELVKYHSFAA
jgi:hypothetical protein